MDAFPRTWAEVDLSALRHNLEIIRSKLSPSTRIALVTKADAYGHGLIPTSRAAIRFGVDWLAVATVQEGISLREAGIECPILVLAPVLHFEAKHAVYHNLRVLVESFEAAQSISAAATNLEMQAILHLAIDTGMSRFGIQAERACETAKSITNLPNIKLEGVGSHFANSGRDPHYTKYQLERFKKALDEINKAGVEIEIRHIANSGALINYPDSHFEMIRIGIFAYGISHIDTPPENLRPVLTWKTRIMAMRELPPGCKVGYNTSYETQRTSRIATLGIGYGDGYHRFLGNKGEVMVHNKRVPITGVVCMDQLMVDVTDVPEAKIGDEVGLITPPLTAEYLASLVGTTPHEIPTRIMSRVPRKYINP